MFVCNILVSCGVNMFVCVSEQSHADVPLCVCREVIGRAKNKGGESTK